MEEEEEEEVFSTTAPARQQTRLFPLSLPWLLMLPSPGAKAEFDAATAAAAVVLFFFEKTLTLAARKTISSFFFFLPFLPLTPLVSLSRTCKNRTKGKERNKKVKT
jgi:hypothetical protein